MEAAVSTQQLEIVALCTYKNHLPPAKALHKISLQAAVQRVPQPKEVFSAVYNHFLQLADSVAWPQGTAGHSSLPAEPPSLAAFVGKDPLADRILCLRAMSQIYEHHAGEVGARFWQSYLQHHLAIHPSLVSVRSPLIT